MAIMHYDPNILSQVFLDAKEMNSKQALFVVRLSNPIYVE